MAMLQILPPLSLRPAHQESLPSIEILLHQVDMMHHRSERQHIYEDYKRQIDQLEQQSPRQVEDHHWQPEPLPTLQPPIPSPLGSPFHSFSVNTSLEQSPPSPQRRLQSISGQPCPAFLQPSIELGPRRASTGCLSTAFSLSPGSPSYSWHHQRPSPDRDLFRQRRNSKQAIRRRRSHPELTPPLTPPSFSSHRIEPATSSSNISSNSNSFSFPAHPTTSSSSSNSRASAAKKEKRNNTPYTFEQEIFIIYHRVDLEMPWDQVRAAYMRRWPGLKRTTGAVQCEYYRTNAKVPAVTPDGLLMLVDPETEAESTRVPVGLPSSAAAQGSSSPGSSEGSNGWWSGEEDNKVMGDDESDGDGSAAKDAAARNKDKDAWYKVYKGVAFRTRWVPCRQAKFSLMERFPEELVDEKNDWVREEHRIAARDIGKFFSTCL